MQLHNHILYIKLESNEKYVFIYWLCKSKGSKDWILKLGWGQNKSAKYYKSDLSFKYMFNAKLFFLSNTMNPD